MKKIIIFTLINILFISKLSSQEINIERIKKHLKYLASDELEGRETTFPGQKVAAKYIATHFGNINLKNIGKENSYLQSFPLIQSKISNECKIEIISNNNVSTKFSFGNDFLPTMVSNDTTIESEIVFGGFGLYSKTGYSDYDTSFDYKGKVILVLQGGIFDSTTPQILRNRLSAPFIKRIYASKFGASALLIVEESDNQSFTESNKKYLNNLIKGQIYSSTIERKDIPVILINKYLANKLLEGSKYNIDSLKNNLTSNKSNSTKLLNSTKIKLNLINSVNKTTSENVYGIKYGSDAKLKDEFIIVTAHYDHVGKDFTTNEIYNGADDDASGSSALMEIAETISKQNTKRSILFLPVSGEEKGLLGSSFYVENPIISLDKSITNINIDMIGRVDPKYDSLKSNNYIYVIGSDKLSLELDSILNVVNNKSLKLKLDYTFNDDNDPNQFYRRSDHYNFAKNNIPVIFFFNGTHKDYHKETDEYDKIDFDALEKRTKLIYNTIIELANAKTKPKLK